MSGETVAGSGLRALRRLAAAVDPAAAAPRAAPPSAFSSGAISLASDRGTTAWATTSALGVDADGSLLAALGVRGLGIVDSDKVAAAAAAAAMGDWPAVFAAIDNGGASVNGVVGGEARTALHYASASGRPDVVRALLAAGAAATSRTAAPSRWTPLHSAASATRPADVDAGAWSAALAEIAVLLLEANADVSAREGDSGATALHFAAARNYAPVVFALLSAGADPSLEDRFGDTAAEIADDAGHKELASALRRD